MRWLLLLLVVGCASVADVPEPPRLSTLDKLDSLRRQFGHVAIDNAFLGSVLVSPVTIQPPG